MQKKKLVLRRETLRKLDSQHLLSARGGTGSAESQCQEACFADPEVSDDCGGASANCGIASDACITLTARC